MPSAVDAARAATPFHALHFSLPTLGDGFLFRPDRIRTQPACRRCSEARREPLKDLGVRTDATLPVPGKAWGNDPSLPDVHASGGFRCFTRQEAIDAVWTLTLWLILVSGRKKDDQGSGARSSSEINRIGLQARITGLCRSRRIRNAWAIARLTTKLNDKKKRRLLSTSTVGNNRPSRFRRESSREALMRPESDNCNGRVQRQNPFGCESPGPVKLRAWVDAQWRCRVRADCFDLNALGNARTRYEHQFFRLPVFFLSKHRIRQ